MGTPLGPKYIPYTYMDPLGIIGTVDFGFIFDDHTVSCPRYPATKKVLAKAPQEKKKGQVGKHGNSSKIPFPQHSMERGMEPHTTLEPEPRTHKPNPNIITIQPQYTMVVSIFFSTLNCTLHVARCPPRP